MISRILLSFIISILFSVGIKSQYITVDTNYTAESLVRDIFIGPQNASCITVSNFTANGWQNYGTNSSSYGYFDKGTSDFELEKGIILSTGAAINAPGPNNVLLDDQDSSWPGDQDLADALRENVSQYLNSTALEFDFVATNTSGISFEYLFLSEEYRSNNCQYSDGFAFLIKKAGTSEPYVNIALVPGTQDPVTSLSINTARDCPRNIDYFGSFNGTFAPTAFNGQTKILTAQTDIIPGVKYHIKLVIADHLAGSDRTGRYDSAVFLKAGSFVGKKDLGPDFIFSSNNALCVGTPKTLDATTAGATSYQWFKDGSPIVGATNPTFAVEGLPSNNGIYSVDINSGGCKIKGSIKIEFAETPIVADKSFCNYNNGDPISINLQDLNEEIISNYKDYFEVKYYEDPTHSQLLPDDFSYTTDTTIYVSVKSGSCAIVDKIIKLNTPRKSLTLNNQTICNNAATTLVAEDDFQYYKWMREDGTVIDEGWEVYFIDNIGVGKYSIELTSLNNCKLTQEVQVFAAELPVITNVDVSGSTATVFVTGGTAPYEYSLDNILFQTSNIFTNIPRGLHKVYVRDAINCETIEKEFLIINLINVLTPNGDGQNDFLDYSDLSIKKDVKIEIYDRFGSRVFQSKNNQFIWDGKLNGNPLSTGNYWYLLSWIEPDTNLPINYTGWILLKNRN